MINFGRENISSQYNSCKLTVSPANMQASLGKLRKVSDFHLESGELVLGGRGGGRGCIDCKNYDFLSLTLNNFPKPFHA